MKICILSMQQIDNYGSLLQAYGLKRSLENLGAQAAFLDILPIPEDDQLRAGNQLAFLAEREGRGLAGKLKKIDRYTLNRLQIKARSLWGRRYFQAFREQYLPTADPGQSWDLCVIGSDEVFNCMNAGAWGFTSQLFGNVPQAAKVITYAASCGATTYRDLPDPVALRIRESFQKVSAFSVRDKNTHAFVSQLTDKPVAEHLDPVLIYDFSREVSQVLLPRVPKNFCIVYSYYNRFHRPEEIQKILTFCQAHGLTPVTLGQPQFWIRRHITCTPFQCLKLFEAASFVITDTFHGTIFSAKYASRFAVLARSSNQNKLLDLVRRLRLTSHLIPDMDHLESAYAVEKDPAGIQALLSRERQKTLDYLSESVTAL